MQEPEMYPLDMYTGPLPRKVKPVPKVIDEKPKAKAPTDAPSVVFER
jgi:hypothetical protein